MATLPRIKFIWGGSKVIRGRWRLGLFGRYDRIEGEREGGLAVSVRGLLAWSAVLMVVAYFAGATALFYLWQRNQYNLLTYTDAVFYPLRQETIAIRKGQAFIAQGTDLWRARRHHDAANLLRAGLARYPQDLRARLTLSQYYVLLNRRSVALQVLEEGLGNDWPGRAYVRSMFIVAEEAEDYDVVIRCCERFRDRLTGEADELDRRWLIGRHFATLIAAKRADEALALALAHPPGDEAKEHHAIALLELGRHAEAIALLEEWSKDKAAAARFINRLQVRAYREAKRYDEMARVIAELRRASPTSPVHAVYGIVQWAMAGQSAAADAAFTDFIFRFGGQSASLQLLAEPLAEVGDIGLIQRCITAAKERGFPLAPLQGLLIQAAMLRGDWATASATFRAIPPPTPRESERGQGQLWREWTGAVIDAATTPAEGAQTLLVEVMRRRPWPIKMFRRTIEPMRQAGRLETARDLSAIAAGLFPASEWVRAQAAEIEAAIAARNQPAVAGAGEAATARRTWTERAFFTELDAYLQEKKWDDASGHITALRDLPTQPDWVAKRDGDLRLAQARIAYARGNSSELIAAIRLYLNGDAHRSNAIMDFAREIRAADAERALELVREVRRRSPDYPPAQRLIAEWTPKK